MTRWWMVRAGDSNELLPLWEEKGIASIGWPSFEDPQQYQSKKEMKEATNEFFNEEKPGTRNSWVNQV